MSEVLQSQETIRLYEYEPYKPDLEDYIEHHGVKDMHWGVRNGPPYPLSSKLSTGSRLKKGAKGAGGSYGGNPDRLKKKVAKASVKAAKANKKAAQAGNSLLHPFKAKKKDKLQTKAFRAQAKADKLNAKLNKEELKETAKKKTDEIKRQNSLEELKNALTKELNDPKLLKQRQAKIDKEVEDARKSGMYDMEFLERNLDLNPKTETQLKGKALDDAYRKFLDERGGFDGVIGRDVLSGKYGGGFREIRTSEKISELDEKKKKEKGYLKIKPQTDMTVEEARRAILEEFNKVSREAGGPGNWGGKMSEVAMQKAEKLQEKYKKLSYDDAMKVVTGEKKLDDVVKKTFSEKRRDKKEQEKKAQSLEKARQTKAENTAKKKAEEAEKERISKMREEAIKKNDIVTMYKNADHFSNAEIEAALSRKGVVDRLAEAVKSTPQPSKSAETQTQTSTPAPVPKKEKYLKNMIKTKLVEGLKETAENKTKQIAKEALKMTIEELAMNAAGVGEDKSKWTDAQKLERKRQIIKRLVG